MSIIAKDPEGVPYEVQEGYSKVGIYQVSGKGMYGSKDPAVYGINWSAHGTVTIEEAEEYMKLMKEAIELARTMNAVSKSIK